MAERILVLAVDSDNDLYRKTRMTGPVTGRADNLMAAAKLALADPQDTDANAMFEAVRKYDELKKEGYSVSIATITGAEKEGYVADAELARQIELMVERFKSDACVLVTDGKSDSRVLPLLKTRLKVNSVDMVRMKQAETLENTYFTLFEKLKEPHYARIFFGIPAVLLILFAASYYFGLGWQLPVALIGVYLIIKGFGLEDSFFGSFRGLGFSVDRLSFVFYIGTILLFIISLIIGYGSYASALVATKNQLTLAAYAIEGFLILIPLCLALYLIGRVMDLESKRMRYMAIARGTYVGYMVVVVALLYLSSAWLIGQIYFWQLLAYGAIVLVFGYCVAMFSSFLRKKVIGKAKVKDKSVINDTGAYVGRVTKVDPAQGFIFVRTDYGNVIRYDIDRITNVSDRVIIR